MAFLRRGTIKVPHKDDRVMRFTRVGNVPITIYLKDISCWEEHNYNPNLSIVIVYLILGSNFSVLESFEAIDEEINGKAVPNG